MENDVLIVGLVFVSVEKYLLYNVIPILVRYQCFKVDLGIVQDFIEEPMLLLFVNVSFEAFLNESGDLLVNRALKCHVFYDVQGNFVVRLLLFLFLIFIIFSIFPFLSLFILAWVLVIVTLFLFVLL